MSSLNPSGANVWNPKSLVEISADTKSAEERLTAIAGQTLFFLQDFIYTVGVGSLSVHKNGLLLAKGVDWVEQTSGTFSLVFPALAGDTIVATGLTAITGIVDIRDTDIYVTNYQAVRDYAGTELTLYSQGSSSRADGGESFFGLITGAALGFYVDNNSSIIVPTGGDGSSAWVRRSPYTINVNTLAEGASLTGLVAGATVVNTKENSLGNGGSGVYDTLLTSAVPAGSISIVTVLDPTLSLVLRIDKEIFTAQSGTSDAQIQAALDSSAEIIKFRGVYPAPATEWTVPANKTLDLTEATLTQPNGITLFNCGSNVTVLRGELLGTSNAYRAGEYSIYCTGTRNGAGVAPTRITAPTILHTKFTNIGSNPIELLYTENGKVDTISIKDCGFAGLLGFSTNGLKVTNFNLDGLLGESMSGELNAYGITFTSDASSADLVRDPPSSDCSVNGFEIKNVTTWHALDTHGGVRIVFKGGTVLDCRRGVILTSTVGSSPYSCIVSNVDCINTLPDAQVASNGQSVHGEAFWDVGKTNILKTSNNTFKNLTARGHGTADSTLGAIYTLNSDEVIFEDITIDGCFYAGYTPDSDTTNVSMRGLTVRNMKVSTASGFTNGINSKTNDVTGDLTGLFIRDVSFGLFSVSAVSGFSITNSDVKGTVTDYDLSAPWIVEGHIDKGGDTVTFSAANSAVQAVVFNKKYKTAPIITGLTYDYNISGSNLTGGITSLSNTGFTVVLSTTDALSVAGDVAFSWQAEGK